MYKMIWLHKLITILFSFVKQDNSWRKQYPWKVLEYHLQNREYFCYACVMIWTRVLVATTVWSRQLWSTDTFKLFCYSLLFIYGKGLTLSKYSHILSHLQQISFENIMANEKNAYYKQFLLLLQFTLRQIHLPPCWSSAKKALKNFVCVELV